MTGDQVDNDTTVTRETISVTGHTGPRFLSRRSFLAGSAGAAGLLVAGRAGLGSQTQFRVAPVASASTLHLAATDGWASMAQDAPHSTFWPDPWAPSPYDMYVFGFRDVTGLTDAEVTAQRGLAQISAPVLAFDEYDVAANNDVRITLTNLGLSMRPDLTDGHTIHWHGFVNAIPLFDGVPELSISVPIGRNFTYYYRPHDPGTYMYHCHFEDVEHVQMGMTGIVYVRPKQNGTNVGSVPAGHQLRYAYNDGDGTTQYDREFSFMINEIWAEAHFRDAHIQTTDWTDYAPSFWTLNGRSFPDTIERNGDPMSDVAGGWPGGQERLRYQPISSLVRCNSGERVLLRMSNLGYQNHTLTCDQIPLTVVAKDSVRLANADGVTHYLTGSSVEIGPGESRDVIFTAPTVSARTTFLFYDRNYAYLNNGGGSGLGGQMTHIEVRPPGDPAPTPVQDINEPNS
jgi:FtsP/CotA-like multicopper oxidase with cupredoxin domain